MDSLFKAYGIIAFIFFSLVFLLRVIDFGTVAPTGRKYGYIDHFFLSVALGLTFPYAIIILFFRGARHGPKD